MNNKQKEDTATLAILQAIENQNDVTQRHLANKLDVALGLANSYFKRCVRKGLIKVQQAPANRYLYYLTPKGFTEKSRLTASYLSSSFNFYRDTSQSLSEIFTTCEQKGHTKILLCGVSELAEIASIRAHDHNLKIIGVYAPKSEKQDFLHLPVLSNLDHADEFNACLLTELENPLTLYKSLITKVDPELIYIPSILGIRRE
jgi:DNA-binding MarR family transcriptional regulator